MPHSSTQVTHYKKPLYIALLATLILSTVSCISAKSPSMTAVTLKTTDYCVSNDRQIQAADYKSQSAQQRTMNCMLNELQTYQQKDMSARQQYFAYKAQAWLSYAIHKDSMNSHSAAGSQALRTAETILQALKSNQEQKLKLIEDIPSTSALMRPDLWATLNALKDKGGIVNAPREMAFSEVALIWAATDYCDRGTQSSISHFRMADRWLEQARDAFVNAHDSTSNVALEELIARYFEQYAPLDSNSDTCRGQILPTMTQY